MPKTKRIPKTKNQLLAETEYRQKVDREKVLVKLMFPFVSTQKTIYDAQTALSALAGFLKFEMGKQQEGILVSDLKIDFSKEPESEIKKAMLNLYGLVQPEKAKDVAALLERFGNTLAQYSANQFMKNPMSDISIDKIVASDDK